MPDVPAKNSARPAAIYLIKQLEIAVRHQLEQALKGSDLTAVQYSLLSQLEARPGSTSAELARRWRLRPQSTNEVILNLERDGYIERSANPAHRRQLLISLTPKGEVTLGEAHQSVSVLNNAIDAAMPTVPGSDFRDMLNRARQALEDLDAGGADEQT